MVLSILILTNTGFSKLWHICKNKSNSHKSKHQRMYKRKQGIQNITQKIETMRCSLLSCTLIFGWMFRIAKSQNLGQMPPIADPNNVFVLPSEEVKHEATWLQWPHNYGWDSRHIRRYEDIWVEMTRALHTGEKVRIIAYNRRQKRRIRGVLKANGLDMNQIQFYTYPTDDVWIRDNGPIFVQDQQGNVIVEDWQFNGWVSESINQSSDLTRLRLYAHNDPNNWFLLSFEIHRFREARRIGGTMITSLKMSLGN